MTFGEDWGWGSNRETSKAIFDTFLKAGGNFIDTADVYTEGSSEEMLGDFIQAERDYIELGFPHDFVLRSGAQKMIYGGMVDQIEGNKNPNL